MLLSIQCSYAPVTLPFDENHPLGYAHVHFLKSYFYEVHQTCLEVLRVHCTVVTPKPVCGWI